MNKLFYIIGIVVLLSLMFVFAYDFTIVNEGNGWYSFPEGSNVTVNGDSVDNFIFSGSICAYEYNNVSYECMIDAWDEIVVTIPTNYTYLVTNQLIGDLIGEYWDNCENWGVSQFIYWFNTHYYKADINSDGFWNLIDVGMYAQNYM